MNRNADWLRYLRMLIDAADQGVSSREALLADHWAHDPSCVRAGVQHRRVGAVHGGGSWLEAGVTAHLRAPARTPGR